MIKASILMAIHNKAYCLRRVLDSIFSQNPPFEFEVICVDDCSYDQSWKILCEFPRVKKISMGSENYIRNGNPARALNKGAKEISGEITILQSADVEHMSPNAIERLCDLEENRFNISKVVNVFTTGQIQGEYTGPESNGRLFFLGSLRTEHFIQVGGFSEEFTQPGSEDVWFLWNLTEGLKLQHKHIDVLGYHRDHGRPSNSNSVEMIHLVNKMNQEAKDGKREWKGSLKKDEFRFFSK